MGGKDIGWPCNLLLLGTCLEAMENQGANKKRKRSGGIQQRLAADEAEAPMTSLSDGLANYLMQQWAWGHVSPQEVQRLAHAAILDMKGCGLEQLPPFLLKLSHMGSDGVHENNIHKEMLRMASQGCLVPEPLQVQITFTHGLVLQPLMLPHVLFSHMYHHYRNTFNKVFMPKGKSQLKAFWRNYSHHPAMLGHEAFSVPSFDQRMLPINLHGDAAPIVGKGKVWCKMMLILSFTGFLAEGSTQETCNLIYGASRLQKGLFCQVCKIVGVMGALLLSHVEKELCHLEAYESLMKSGANGTLDQIFKIISWSFNCLLDGKFPEADWAGRKQDPQCI